MMLHARLSPESLEILRSQRRKITITSVVISILIVLLIGIVLWSSLRPSTEVFTSEIVSCQTGVDDDENVEKHEMSRFVARKPSVPSMAILGPNVTEKFIIPVPDIEYPSALIGDGDGTDDGWEDDDGESQVLGCIPADMRSRCSKRDRLSRLNKNGGNERCEEAVVKSLRWLKKTQNKDGSWCKQYPVAMTGFAVLAYLGHCEIPLSEEYGDSVTRGIVYLVNVAMKNNGKLTLDTKGHWSYEHAIATYALGEATIFCNKLGINIPNLKEATEMAGDWIMERQHSNGSWTYHYEQSSGHFDNSIGCWQLQALKACKHTGIWKKGAFDETIRKALAFIKKTQNQNGGIGYTSQAGRDIGWTMTGGGVLAYQMWGKEHDSLVGKGARYIRKNAKFEWNTADSDLYRHYYHAQAMMNRGGADWAFYNKLFRDQILDNQNPDGSYKNVAGGGKVNGVETSFAGESQMATHYRTCLATFMLEVYYRFLPTTGGGH